MPKPLQEALQIEPETEPAPAPAQFVEEIEFPPPDEGGTLVIPPGLVNLSPDVDQTGVHTSLTNEAADVGATLVLPPEADLTAETAETGALPSSYQTAAAAADLGETEVLPSLEMDEDVTFVLNRLEGEEISAHLICTTGPHAGEVLKLKPGVTTIGRSSENSFPLAKDKEASRRHALIVYEASKFVLQDQNSLNGTFVNDQLIKEPYPLQDGDIILIGVSTLKFQESAKK
jgi:hypothetical protein